MKKAQVAGQIFIYITAIVIVGLIIVYGYSAIKGFTERGEEVEYITMQKSVENAVKSIAASETSDICQSRAGREKYHQPIVCSGWKTGRNNVFLIPDGSESFDVGNIVMEHGNFLCFDVFNNKINLQLTGLGDRVEISSYS
jgi:hypothetical protein